MAQWLSGYTGPENDSISSVAWVDEPTLGKGVVLAGSTNSFGVGTAYFQAWVAMTDTGGEFLWQRLNEEGQIPTDCLVDADPPLEAVSHDYLFEQVDDEPAETERVESGCLVTAAGC